MNAPGFPGPTFGSAHVKPVPDTCTLVTRSATLDSDSKDFDESWSH
jgi:hypothetical protein